MSKSLISDKKECLMCGTTKDLHKHHVYPGTANRKKSEQDGCWVYLCARHHNMSNYSVHFNKELDRRLKAYCQTLWEKKYGDRTAFIHRFGKSYLKD